MRRERLGSDDACGCLDVSGTGRRTLLVLASTYPRWAGDPEPAFVHELCKRLRTAFDVVALVPDAPGADASGPFEGVEVIRYRYAPRSWQTLVNNGGIMTNLRRNRWKLLLVPPLLLAREHPHRAGRGGHREASAGAS
jgi:hypothetical protein